MTATEEARKLVEEKQQIGPDLAVRLLEEAVASKGADYIYVNQYGERANENPTGCQNLHNLNILDRDKDPEWVPGCLVGHVLVNVFGIEKVDPEGSVLSLNQLLGNPFTKEAESVLGRAQFAQDRGETWGRALEDGKEYHGR